MSSDYSQDAILPFQLESSPVRGRLVRLREVVDTVLDKHCYPHDVSLLLAKTLPLAAALGTSLKFDGVFTLQTQTDGPVSRMVVDVTTNGAVRGCVTYDPDRLAKLASGEALLGCGHLVFTVDQTLSDERYQGIVEVQDDNLLEAFQRYFRQSEQIPTGLVVGAKLEADGWRAGCLMLQKMPEEGGVAGLSGGASSVEDDWGRIMTLMQTCTTDELVDPDLPPQDLLFRLFHEEGVRVYDPVVLCHQCRCSRQRIEGLLASMPQEEIEAMRLPDGRIEVTCQFCGETASFDKIDK